MRIVLVTVAMLAVATAILFAAYDPPGEQTAGSGAWTKELQAESDAVRK
ncbi:hypothetical protein [Litchfieldella xinjiangensis]|nr:hypothetical protein [Halomonas xinjiangensis]